MLKEESLIKDLQNTKTQDKAFKDLIDLYKEPLYWHIRKIVISHEDADDVLQNTFIKVYKFISKFNGKSKLYTWIYRIATNESITHLKKNAKIQRISNEELQNNLVENLQSDVFFDGDEIQVKLQKAIATLPQKQLLVFNMKYFDDMKYQEMSEILETSVGALKASYHHAKKKIEHYLTSN